MLPSWRSKIKSELQHLLRPGIGLKNKEGEQKSKDAKEGERNLDSCSINLRLLTNIKFLALGDRRLRRGR
jgi:hypothetical protein